ncbi:protein-L-isoaspartate(D-aspartate) O-methyltransferase [Kiritimatiella glycovorans]|uniref:Protein-L-isoaspartate O-methyltransferase n=1 Tax=Kiritimatiella glycovorans TaxID=1307763 RepID=A0A0G3ECK7_9BACT|nr:protein-L-isoaspartate(D-aspartate) O-methyltransferase [Kiritimatiella glycovorans]AKJ64033.1 Protein-L-isoaspartate O-methyltransferase [Kiritimatiella glycovorans]
MKHTREIMMERHLKGRGIRHPAVLRAMEETAREAFVSDELHGRAYDDRPLPIGNGQTISQPYIVAYMTEQLDPNPGDRVLEIGAGSGYQAAVLARIVREVITVEIIPSLAEQARETLAKLGITNVTVHEGDGNEGWIEEAPYDGIIATAAPERIPPALREQLARGGRMILPVGPAGGIQVLKLLRRDERGALHERELLEVRFVPMTR